jgi:hypothetical protein
MADKRWKARERRVATPLGTTRNPNNGRRQADIDTARYAVGRKCRL